MKSIELFCASPASTAICSSMEQYNVVRHQTHRLGELLKSRTPACTSELPLDPRRYFHQKSRKSSSKHNEIRRKSSADITDIQHSPPNNSSRFLLGEKTFLQSLGDSEHSSALYPYNSRPIEKSVNEKMKVINNSKELAVFRSFSARSNYDESPVYKLPNSTTLGRSSHEYLAKNSNTTTLARSSLESPVYRLSSARSNDMQLHKSTSTCTRNQVVELRVSIHCKGCEGKVRKHLSKMEGVKSFSIDLVSKKVTVVGNVTSQSVLASISKVKNAQFWPSPTPSSSSSSSTSSSSSSSLSRRA